MLVVSIQGVYRMSTSFAKTFQVSNPKTFKLSDRDPRDKCGLDDKDKVKIKTAEDAAKIDELQIIVPAQLLIAHAMKHLEIRNLPTRATG